MSPTGESAGSRARAAVLLGVAGLFFCNLILGPLAIGLGVTAGKARGTPARTRAGALAGVVLGAADLAVLAVLIAAAVRRGGGTWHFGS